MAIGRSRLTGADSPSSLVYFLSKVYSVAANTFVEAVRQPVFAVILGVSAALIALSPYITMFALQETKKLMVDMGLATVMLAGLLMAAFSASSVISQEIENRTVLTVIAKPVGRSEFILGKFLGVLATLTVGTYLLSLVLVLTISCGSLVGDYEERLSLALALAIAGAIFLSVCYGVYSNFFHDRPFPSRTIGAAIPLFTICFIVFGFANTRASINEEMWGAFGKGFDMQVVYACLMMMWAVLVLAAVAIAISTRLTVVVNVAVCSGVFLLGLLSDYFFKQYQETAFIAKVLYRIIPNLQVFWVADLLTAKVPLPFDYVIWSGAYALCQILAFLFLGMLLFQERQVA